MALKALQNYHWHLNWVIRIRPSPRGMKAVRSTKDVDGRGCSKRRKPACFNREFRKIEFGMKVANATFIKQCVTLRGHARSFSAITRPDIITAAITRAVERGAFLFSAVLEFTSEESPGSDTLIINSFSPVFLSS